MMILILDSIKMFNISDKLMIEMFISVHFQINWLINFTEIFWNQENFVKIEFKSLKFQISTIFYA